MTEPLGAQRQANPNEAVAAPPDGLGERLDTLADVLIKHPDGAVNGRAMTVREAIARIDTLTEQVAAMTTALNEKVQHHIDVHSDCPPKSHASPSWMYRDQGDHP